MSCKPNDDETLDVILRGRVQLLQSRRGYRTSVDAMLLAWFSWCQAPEAQRVADYGAGTGLVAICFGLVARPSSLTLIEKQTSLLERARRNLALNGVQGSAQQHDLAQGPALDVTSLDLAMSNPPYYRARGRVLPPHPERRSAHYESTAGVELFCRAAAASLAADGVLCVVYPADDLERLVRAFSGAGLGRMQVQLIHHRDLAEAPVRVLVAGRFGDMDVVARPPVALHPSDTRDDTYRADIEAFVARMGMP